MENREQADVGGQKKRRPVDREINTAVIMLRRVQCGISVSDLELLSIGMVNDMFTERMNDDYDYKYLATQEDIDQL